MRRRKTSPSVWHVPANLSTRKPQKFTGIHLQRTSPPARTTPRRGTAMARRLPMIRGARREETAPGRTRFIPTTTSLSTRDITADEVDLPGGQLAAQGEFDLGNGSGGPGAIANDTGIQVVGTVTDADTGRPIANALVVSPSLAPTRTRSWRTLTAAMGFSSGRTDAQGQFTLRPPGPGAIHTTSRRRWMSDRPAVRLHTPFAIDQNTQTPFQVTIQLQAQ